LKRKFSNFSIDILATRHRPNGFSALILIIIISIVVAMLLLTAGIFIYIKQKGLKKNKHKYPDYDEHTKKNFIERLFKCFCLRKRSEIIPFDQSLTGLLDELSTSTTGPG